MAKWYETAVFFHMYPFGMVGADKINTQNEASHHFNELKTWLPHIKELGINAIYIGPLFESYSHGYDTTDYYQIDKRLGTNDEFKDFVSSCHDLNIKVVVDGVFNHTGKKFFAFQDILKNRENSKYKDWYKDVCFDRKAPSGEPFYFAAWRNIYDLANLNLYNPEVKQYLLDVISFWIHEFDIDGIRLDCADCLPFEFISEIRSLTKNLKQDFWLMGELIHGDYSRWVNEKMLDSSTNYELHKALYSAHNDHNYFEIAHSIKRQFDNNSGIYRGMFLYSFVDNHDVDRIASKLNNKQHLLPVHILLFTLPGIPSIYYGSQWGIEGKKINNSDDLLRPQLNVEYMINHNPHPELTDMIQKLASIKKSYYPLSYGKYKELYLTNRQYAYARIMDNEVLIMALNNDDDMITISIPCPFPKTIAMDLLSDDSMPIVEDTLTITLAANEGRIYKLN